MAFGDKAADCPQIQLVVGSGMARTETRAGQLGQPLGSQLALAPILLHPAGFGSQALPLLGQPVLSAGLLVSRPHVKPHAGPSVPHPTEGALVCHPLARFSWKFIL